jgi:hypothetical protein
VDSYRALEKVRVTYMLSLRWITLGPRGQTGLPVVTGAKRWEGLGKDFCVCVCLFVCFETDSLCSPGWPQTYDPPASAS